MTHAVVDTVSDIGTGIKNLIVGGDKEADDKDTGDKDLEEKKEDLKDDL
jgi:hypothetical protein